MNENGGDVGGSSGGKSWERSWTTEEMRQNAHSWNLAGDSGLLKHLQEFSQTVLARTHATEKALDSLVEEVNNLTAEANTVNNKFLCLANTQFVENRVYDDDDKETPQAEPVTEKKSKEETDAKMLQKVREALSMSVAVLDTMFEPVEIQASDSEGESEIEAHGTKTLILEPHNPYIHRPLPHLIGSEAFMSDDHIGLGDSPSDGEEQSLKDNMDHEMDASSESDVDFPAFGSTKRTRDMYSSQSSVSDHICTKDTKKIKPVDPIQNMRDGSGEHEVSARQLVPENNTFAAQLAAKLGKIASPPPPTDSHSPVEKSTLQTKTISDDLFGGGHSEDEDDALFSGGSGLFSGPPKLFDDLEDTSSSLWGADDNTSKNVKSEIIKTEPALISKPQPNKLRDDLFSSAVSDDEDDLFSIKSSKSSKTVDTKPQREFISSEKSKQHLLKVGGIRPGIVTSTPERGYEEEIEPTCQIKQDEGKSTTLVPSMTPTETQTLAPGGGSSSNAYTHGPANSNDTSHSKKPTGGVPMFGQANVLAGLKAKLPRRPSSSSSESSTCDPHDRAPSTAPKPQMNPSHDVPSSDQGWSSTTANFRNSQSLSGGFSSPALTSTRLSDDDGYQSKHVSNSISSIPPANGAENDSDNDDIFSNKSSTFTSQHSQQNSGRLFAEINDDEDDLFAVDSSLQKETRKPSLDFSAKSSSSSNQPSKESTISSATPSKENENSTPQGILQTSSSSSMKSNPEKNYPPTDFSQNDIYSTVPPPLKSEGKMKKPVSLFDDSDSGEDELLFSSASSAGSRRSQASTDILAASAVSTVEKKPLGKKGLFDDDDALFGNTRNDPDIDIFSGASKTSQSRAVLRTPPPLSSDSFVEEEPPSKSDTNSPVHNAIIKSTDDIAPTIPIKVAKSLAPKSIFQDDLFADKQDEGDDDDLFSSKPSNTHTNKSVLFPPPVHDNGDDDLFQDVAKQSQKPPQSLGAVSCGPSQEDNTAKPTPNLPKPSNHSLVSEYVGKNTSEEVIASSALINRPVKLEVTKDEPSPNAQQQLRKPEPPRTLDIRKETDPALGLIADSDDDDDDDLFVSSTKKIASKPEPPPKQPAKPTPRPKQSVKPALSMKPETEASKPSIINANDGAENGMKTDDKKQEQHREVDGTAVSVSKLRDSLLAGGNGQPALLRALVPGQKPPPRRTPPKEDACPPSVAADGAKPPSLSVDTECTVGFDQPAVNNTTLPSTNKDRAKLGVKRRPPSNKARREAARASMNLDNSDRESPLSPDGSSARTDSVGATNTSLHSNNSVLSPSTDEDDLFGVPQDFPSEYGNQSVPSADIFSGTPFLSPAADAGASKYNTKNKDFSGKGTEEGDHSSSERELSISSEKLEDPISESLFKAAAEVRDTVSSDQLFAPIHSAASKPLMAADDLFAPTASAKSSKAVVKPSTALEPSDANLPEEKSTADSLPAVPKPTSALPTHVSEPTDCPKTTTSASEHFNEGSSFLSPLPISHEEPIATSATEGVADIASRQVETTVSSALRPARASSDPLNKADQSAVSDEGELFAGDRSEPDFDDHSSLFPFVKKKPEKKLPTHQPLFSQTPALPSKAEKPARKPDFGGLDDVEDEDLFSSSSKVLPTKKTQDVVSDLKGKEKKTWNFSDEDDDDLFQSGSKSALIKPSTKPVSSIPASTSSSTASAESSLPSRSPAPDEGIKKSKPAQVTPKNGLFDDEVDDDDLFSKPTPFSKNKSKDAPPKKSPLFDDDDDDLFGPTQTTSVKNKETRPKKTTNVPPVPSSVDKKGNVFNDPLMALQDDK